MLTWWTSMPPETTGDSKWSPLLLSQHALPQKLSTVPYCPHRRLNSEHSFQCPFIRGLYSLLLTIPWTFSPPVFAYSHLGQINLLCWNLAHLSRPCLNTSLSMIYCPCLLLPWNPNAFFNQSQFLSLMYFYITSICFSLAKITIFCS